jgi:hypothetical protein
LGRQIERADLQITMDGDAVTVTRTQPQGGCIYHGVLVLGSAPGTARITGGYHCDWAPKTMYWSATIGG